MTINATTLLAAKSTTGSIKNWVNRDDIPSDDILDEAEAWIFSRLRVREMIKYADLTLTSGIETLAAPSDSICALTLRLDEDSRPLDKLTADQLMQRRYRDSSGDLDTGKPEFYSEVVSATDSTVTYYFDLKTDQAYNGNQVYIARPSGLAASTNETNFLTIRYPTLLRRACLAKAYEHMQDFQRAESYDQRAMQSIYEANQEADLDLQGAIFDMEVR